MIVETAVTAGGIMGMPIDDISLVVLFTPILMPIIIQLGLEGRAYTRNSTFA